MPSAVQVKEKTVNNRDVISFSKEYAGEEHEVLAPKDQGVQVLMDLLTVLNAEKADSDRFVLVRKDDVGALEETEIVTDGDEYKKQTAFAVVETLFDERTASDVMLAIENGGNHE